MFSCSKTWISITELIKIFTFCKHSINTLLTQDKNVFESTILKFLIQAWIQNVKAVIAEKYKFGNGVDSNYWRALNSSDYRGSDAGKKTYLIKIQF